MNKTRIRIMSFKEKLFRLSHRPLRVLNISLRGSGLYKEMYF